MRSDGGINEKAQRGINEKVQRGINEKGRGNKLQGTVE